MFKSVFFIQDLILLQSLHTLFEHGAVRIADQRWPHSVMEPTALQRSSLALINSNLLYIDLCM